MKMKLISVIFSLLCCICATAADPGLTATRADRAFGFGEWAQAEALYELVLHERPDSAPVYARAIVAASLQPDTLRAVELLERAMAHGVALDSVTSGVRRAAMSCGHTAVYADFLKRTRRQMPYMARAIDARLLDYYEFRNDGPQIVRLATEMLRGLPDSARYLSALARGLTLCGDSDGAETAWRRVLDVDPDNVEALRALGLMLRAAGRAAEAHPLLERAQALSPSPYLEKLLK